MHSNTFRLVPTADGLVRAHSGPSAPSRLCSNLNAGCNSWLPLRAGKLACTVGTQLRAAPSVYAPENGTVTTANGPQPAAQLETPGPPTDYSKASIKVRKLTQLYMQAADMHQPLIHPRKELRFTHTNRCTADSLPEAGGWYCTAGSQTRFAVTETSRAFAGCCRSLG